MIAKYFTVGGQEVDKPPIELDTKSIYRAIIMMRELGFEYVTGSSFRPLVVMEKGNERVMVGWS